MLCKYGGQTKGSRKQFVLINKTDSKKRQISNGDKVKVYNDRGSYEGVAEISEDVSEGIVVSSLGYWRQLNKGTVNSISSTRIS